MHHIDALIAELYKTHSARLLAVLTRIFGTHNLDLAEDVLQDAFNKALLKWKQDPLPDKPIAWITQAAKNQAIDTIRANKTKLRFSNDLAQHLESEWSLGSTVEAEFQEDKIKDDQLRMIFMCCHEDIKPENRIPFILKTLCGLSLSAVARALVLSEETVKKRLHRTRNQLKHHTFTFPADHELIDKMDTVHTVLYLLFNEGFYSSSKQQAIHLLFCQEAIGQMNILLQEPGIINQDTLSLLALMHFHIARIDARTDATGQNIPLDMQDRAEWRQEDINAADQLLKLSLSARPGASGRYFIEAQIAAEHCKASSFDQTDWLTITKLYKQLVEITHSPVAELNQAIAMAYNGELRQGIKNVEHLQQQKAFKNSHIALSTLAHLYAKAGDKTRAYKLADQSRELGGTPIEHTFMMQQLERLLSQH